MNDVIPQLKVGLLPIVLQASASGPLVARHAATSAWIRFLCTEAEPGRRGRPSGQAAGLGSQDTELRLQTRRLRHGLLRQS